MKPNQIDIKLQFIAVRSDEFARIYFENIEKVLTYIFHECTTCCGDSIHRWHLFKVQVRHIQHCLNRDARKWVCRIAYNRCVHSINVIRSYHLKNAANSDEKFE